MVVWIIVNAIDNGIVIIPLVARGSALHADKVSREPFPN